ncbi:DnaJ protein homolog 1 (DROJ1) [Durusdinium trenchii]|uniref:DnaJ protein homolog 1 (DROJ1) n=1 Tax=Durusdinium trenchii TaxID=1381693 RepID=A0ABP0MKN2_9DINO
MYRPNGVPKAKERPAPAGGNALVTFDAQLAKQQEEAQLAKERPKPRNDYLDCYTGPKVKWEDTGLYKALVKSQDIEEELTKIRNLIRKRTDPGYDPNDEEDFKVAPVRKFDSKADYYKLLEVDDFASVKDIKGAYKKLALQYHPDKNRDKKPDKLREMQDEFEKIQEAYEILSDRATRRQYDRARFDEARAKSQGMNSSFYSQKTNTDGNFWGRWSGEAKEGGKAVQAKAKATKLPKAADLRLEVKISLEKALRGGLKIREVKRDRMQRAFGGTSQTLKTVNIKIDPGQADGSEYRLPGDGHWPSFNVSPGDLVVVFRHKVHPFLRQVAATAGSAASGALQLASPLQVRAKATQAAVAVWSPTFKGSMVLIRFKNPLLDLAPSKSCNVTFVLEGEGLPLPDTPMKRGPLAITVHVQLDGPALVPSINSSCCKDVLLRRHVKKYNHQGTLRVTLSNPLASGLPVRKYMALDARERAGLKVRLPCVAVVWTSPVGTDPVSFNKAAAALGFHAQGDPQVGAEELAYAWCCHPRLFPQPLPCSSHVSLDDAELHSDDEVIDLPEGKPEPPAASKPEQEFLLRFELGPPGGFDTNAQSDDVRAGEASPHAGPELTRLIREKQGDLEQVKRHWTERKERLSGERQEEDPVKNARGKRELDRVEREMNGLRSNFEFQLQAEKKWVDEFMQTHNYQNQWVCVFKPAMVVRTKPTEDGPISRRLVFDEVVKAKSWKARRTEGPTGWEAPPALTWHKTHGQLLQRWFNAEQQRFNDLQAKIEERRKAEDHTCVVEGEVFEEAHELIRSIRVRNETFVAYRRKKKEVEEWSIPPGPSEEEKCEIEDEECEQLHFLMEPILKELKLHKRRLRELRQKRAEALLERQRKLDGGLSNAPLPVGFEASVEAAEAKGRRSCWQVEGP